MSQPPPTPTTGPAVWDLVLEDMRARDLLGLERYGTRLQAENGRDALLDLYEELQDAVVYVRQEIEERKNRKGGKMHETTRAVLKAARAYKVTGDYTPLFGFRGLIPAWHAAGCPDLDTAPEPDRLAALEARVAALERERPQSPSEPVTPEPPRFVPTAPGWYWFQTYDGDQAIGIYTGCADDADIDWLSPVAPYQPTRTEEEARREPRRGDRWQAKDGEHRYTLLAPSGAGFWRCRSSWAGDLPVDGVTPGLATETYQGNFAHELEEP